MGVIYELYGIPVYDNDIYHSGIKGMHWGIRRYQNPDGTLTPEGRKRYNVGSDGNLYDKETGKKYGLSTKAKVGIGAGAAALAGGAALAADQIFNGGRGRQAIGQFVGNTAQKVGNWAGDRAQDVSDWWTGDNDARRQLADTSQNYMRKAQAVTRANGTAGAGDILRSQAKVYSDAAQNAWNTGARDQISNAAKDAWNGAQNTAQNVGNWVSDRAQAVSDWWTGENDASRNMRSIGDSFANDAKSAASKLGAQQPRFADITPDVAKGLDPRTAVNMNNMQAQYAYNAANQLNTGGARGAIADAAQNAWNGVRDTAQNAWNGAQNAAQNVGNWVSDRAQDVSDWWTGNNDASRAWNDRAQQFRDAGARLSGQAGNAQDAQSIYNTYMDRANTAQRLANEAGTGGVRGAISNAAQNVGDWFGDRAQDVSNWWTGENQANALRNQASEQLTRANAAANEAAGYRDDANRLTNQWYRNREAHMPDYDYGGTQAKINYYRNQGADYRNQAHQARVNAQGLLDQANNHGYTSPQDRFNSAVGSVKNFFGLGADDIGKTVRLDDGRVGKFMGWVQGPYGVYPNIVE